MKKLNKAITLVLVFALIFPMLPSIANAQEVIGINNFIEETDLDTDETIDLDVIEEEFSQEFGTQISEEISIDDYTETEEKLELEMSLLELEDDLSVRIEVNEENDFVTVDGEFMDENHELFYYNYEVYVDDVEGDAFVATFIDTLTGESYYFDSTVAEASALPIVIIAAVARYGIQYAIKKYGKKAVQNIVAKQSYGKVLSSVSSLSAKKRSHILESKHLWSRVTKNNWTEVSKVMSHVMRHGKESAYGSARKKTMKLNGHTVTVTFKRVNGQTKISNGWVNR